MPGETKPVESYADDGDDVDDTEASNRPITRRLSVPAMLEALKTATGADFTAGQSGYRAFMASAQTAVQSSSFHTRLFDIHDQLSSQLVVGKIRAIEAWADGESSFRLVQKSWNSTVDKLYRINVEENPRHPEPPAVLRVAQRALREHEPRDVRWVTPDVIHEVADDLLRTKFVVPFVDGVVETSDIIADACTESGLPWFRRYHAKDSGYHARHMYILFPIPTSSGADAQIALEVKVLTKMQDTLGELTHLLYEKKRTGEVKQELKRKLAWDFEAPDFLASYLGHSGHFLEASIVDLKNRILELEDERGES